MGNGKEFVRISERCDYCLENKPTHLLFLGPERMLYAFCCWACGHTELKHKEDLVPWEKVKP